MEIADLIIIMRKLHHDSAHCAYHNRPHASLLRGVSSTWLTKLAKHLALIVCLMILGEAAGRPVIGQLGIILLVILAALINSVGRALQRRLPVRIPLSKRLS